jgi:thiamine pyrophosphate-dependent acetolactate synthase large subunit-like protein
MLMHHQLTIDRVGMAKSMSIAARRATDLGGLTRELSRGLTSSEPYLIKVVR